MSCVGWMAVVCDKYKFYTSRLHCGRLAQQSNCWPTGFVTPIARETSCADSLSFLKWRRASTANRHSMCMHFKVWLTILPIYSVQWLWYQQSNRQKVYHPTVWFCKCSVQPNLHCCLSVTGTRCGLLKHFSFLYEDGEIILCGCFMKAINTSLSIFFCVEHSCVRRVVLQPVCNKLWSSLSSVWHWIYFHHSKSSRWYLYYSHERVYRSKQPLRC